jgi:hypothetical protein
MAYGRWQNTRILAVFNQPSAMSDAFFTILLMNAYFAGAGVGNGWSEL